MNDAQDYSYATFLNVLYPSLSLIDVPSLAAASTERLFAEPADDA